MDIPVRSRCHRVLRHMPNYYSLLPDTDYFDPEHAKKEYPVYLDDDESLVGVYENKFGYENKYGKIVFEDISPELISEDIVITNKAIHLCSKNKSKKIYFKDITELEGPANKLDDLLIKIYLKDEIIYVPILYIYECGAKDAFGFFRFLLNVIGDQKGSAPVSRILMNPFERSKGERW